MEGGKNGRGSTGSLWTVLKKDSARWRPVDGGRKKKKGSAQHHSVRPADDGGVSCWGSSKGSGGKQRNQRKKLSAARKKPDLKSVDQEEKRYIYALGGQSQGEGRERKSALRVS